MATAKGLIKLSGKLRELVFYQRKKKSVIRQKAKPFLMSEASIKAGKDFGEAIKNASYLRKAFAQGVAQYADHELVNRLNRRFIEIFKTIPKEHQGNKKLADGNLGLLKGFEFNGTTSLQQLLYHVPHCSIDSNGRLHISLAKLPIVEFVNKLPGSEAFMLRLMIFNYELTGDSYEVIPIKPLTISLIEPNFCGAQLQVQIAQKGDRALVIALGILYPLANKICNDKGYLACQIITALHLKDGIIVDFIDAHKPAPPIEEKDKGHSWEMEKP